ncbi:MAG: glycosyltransferase family 4 protein [Clostridium sp.]|nr:glycosyltransferase family 4 protein [Clostridium sp.]MCM1475322.1 glycosyltransferase family 4 protein [Muribaculaceae bacterium]
MNRIIFVSGHFSTPTNTTSRIVTKIACALSKSRPVMAITCDEPDAEESDSALREHYDVDIRRIPLGRVEHKTILLRLYYSLMISWKLTSMIKREVKKDDKVIIVTNPELLMLAVGHLRRQRNFHLTILVHDVFPENTIPAGIFKTRRNIIYRHIERMFNKAYASADRLIVIGEDMKEVMAGKIRGFKNKGEIEIIPNFPGTPSALPTAGRPKPTSEVSENQGKLRVVYAGNVGRVQGIDEIVRLWSKSNNPQAEFHIYGGGVMSPAIDKLVKELGREDIIYHGQFQPESQDEILKNADICLIALSEGMYGLGVPSKSYNIFAAGRPVAYIGDPESELWNVVSRNDIGYCFNGVRDPALSEFIAKASPTLREELSEKGKRAAKLCQEQFSEEIILHRYEELMRD